MIIYAVVIFLDGDINFIDDTVIILMVDLKQFNVCFRK